MGRSTPRRQRSWPAWTWGPRPRSIVFTADGKTAFVTAETGGVVTVLDAVAHKPLDTIRIESSTEAPTPPRPMGSVLSTDGRQVFISNGRHGWP